MSLFLKFVSFTIGGLCFFLQKSSFSPLYLKNSWKNSIFILVTTFSISLYYFIHTTRKHFVELLRDYDLPIIQFFIIQNSNFSNTFADTSIKNLPTVIKFAKKYVNEELLNYCVNLIARHRPEYVKANIQFPSHVTSHPSTYFDVSKLSSELYNREVKGDAATKTEPVSINTGVTFMQKK